MEIFANIDPGLSVIRFILSRMVTIYIIKFTRVYIYFRWRLSILSILTTINQIGFSEIQVERQIYLICQILPNRSTLVLFEFILVCRPFSRLGDSGRPAKAWWTCRSKAHVEDWQILFASRPQHLSKVQLHFSKFVGVLLSWLLAVVLKDPQKYHSKEHQHRMTRNM